MTQTLESVNAYSRAQSDLFDKRYRRSRRFLKNEVWNELIQLLFSGHAVNDLANRYNISDKAIYRWRRAIMTGEHIQRYFLTPETLNIVAHTKLYFRDNHTMKPWQISYLDRLKELNNKEPDVENKVEDQLSSSRIIQAPSGERHLTNVDNPRLLQFLKSQGFTVYKVSLDEI